VVVLIISDIIFYNNNSLRRGTLLRWILGFPGCLPGLRKKENPEGLMPSGLIFAFFKLNFA